MHQASCPAGNKLRFGMLITLTKTSTGTNKMRKTNALYLKRQRLIPQTHKDTQRGTDTQRDTQRYTETERHTKTHRYAKIHTETHTEKDCETQTQIHTKRHTQIHRHTDTHTETHTNKTQKQREKHPKSCFKGLPFLLLHKCCRNIQT